MTELKPFQHEGCRLIYRFRGRALLADEQGLGKTIQALYWIRKIPSRRPCVIVTPACMKYTWQAEAAMHFNMRTDVLEGHWKRGNGRPMGQILIVNYDILASWLPWLMRDPPRCVIFDEVHYLKNWTAKRTRAAVKLVSQADSVVGLSGTPITNRPYEFWPILHIIRNDIFPDRRTFAWTYCDPKRNRWGWTFDGAKRLGQLNRILRRECMIRRLKKDVLKELPEKTRKIISFRLGHRQQMQYDEAQDNFIRWLKERDVLRAKRAAKSVALTKVGYLLRFAAELKLGWTMKWIDEFLESNPGKKLVALTMNTFVIDRLHERFSNSIVIDGRVTGKFRTEAVRRFQTNPRVPLLFGNWKAAGVGITLHAAYHAVSLDMPWTPGDLVQGEDRIHRIGQKKNVIIYYLVAMDTIEERLVRILRRKSEVLDAVLNGRGSAESLDIFNTLIEEIANEQKKI